MFDAGSEGPGVGTYDSGDDRSPERRQYTLKGVETDTIRLMRNAAQKEGMKIGSWVSLRMREAAERALDSEPGSRVENNSTSVGGGAVIAEQALKQVTSLIENYKDITEKRIALMERELHEITSGQRSILSYLVSQKDTSHG